jgi:hypothetical protein
MGINMRFLRLIIISFAALFIVATLIGVLLPSRVLVSRAVNIAVPKDSIMQYVNNIRDWKLWMEGMDDESVHIYSPLKATLGNTEVTVTSVTDTTVVSTWLPRKGAVQTATMHLIGSSGERLTVVQWQFEQKLKWYPWERLGSMMNDKILGTMMENNLNRLKTLAETKK